jgi:hypothetical protein
VSFSVRDFLGFIVNPPPGDPSRTAGSDQTGPSVLSASVLWTGNLIQGQMTVSTPALLVAGGARIRAEWVGVTGDLYVGHDNTVSPSTGFPSPQMVWSVESEYTGDIWLVSASGSPVDVRWRVVGP